jgi:transposase
MVKPPVPARQFELRSEAVGALPIVNHFLERIGLDAALQAFVRSDDRRLRLCPALVLGVVVRNLALDHEPVYALCEWADSYAPGLLGLFSGDVGLLNDDRVGRSLDRLFDADRASLFTAVVLKAVRSFGIDCSELHNDSTTVTFSGEHRGDGSSRGGKATAAITFGHNKDHRPDLRQLVFILTVSKDGAVPLAHRVVSGNTTDDTTHVGSWEELCVLVGRRDFLYVADSKLCTRAAMEHIDSGGGRFVTVMPRSRREDGWFRDWLTRNQAAWAKALTVPARRRGEAGDVLSTFESPLTSGDGYRIIWVHSSAKAIHDATLRATRLQRAERELAQLAERLAGPKTRIRDRVTAEEAARAILADTETANYFELCVTQEHEKRYRAERPGKPGHTARFRETRRPRVRLGWKLRPHVVRHVAASDGCWPLITNDPQLSPAEVLDAYRYQPHLERRHHCLKGTQAVAPVRLHTPARIEALLSCHFLALLVHALIERQIRTAMGKRGISALALYPEERDCAAPSAALVLRTFAGLACHRLYRNGRLVETFEPQLDARQRKVLGLLGVPLDAYRLSR